MNCSTVCDWAGEWQRFAAGLNRLLERRADVARKRERTTDAQRIDRGLGAIAVWVVLQRRDELAGASAILAHLRWPWAAVAIVAEGASFLCYAGLQMRLLRAGGLVPGMRAMMGVTLAGNAIQNSLPGGAAFAGVYAFGQFRRLGADDVLAAWAMVAAAILSNVALAVVAATGLTVAGGQGASLGLVEVIVAIGGFAILSIVVLIRRRVSTGRGLLRILGTMI